MNNSLVLAALTYLFVAIGCAAVLAYASRMVARVWPKREDHSSDILQRLSEVTVAIKEQAVWMKTQPEEKENPLPALFLKFLEDWNAAQVQQQAALDTLVAKVEAQGKYIQLFCRTITGNDPGGYTEVGDEEAAIREKAIEIQRRHGGTWDAALKRAKAMQTYAPGNGFGDSV